MNWEAFYKFNNNRPNDGLVIYRGKIVTYEMAEASVKRISKHFDRLNFTQGSRIGLLIGNNPLFIYCFLSIIRFHASAILFSSNLKSYEIESYLKDAGIRFLIVDESNNDVVKALRTKKKFLFKDSHFSSGSINLWELSHSTDMSIDIHHATNWKQAEFVLQFTSGVSGVSKLVSRSYSNIADEILNLSDSISLSSDDVIVCPVPLFHAYGLINGFLQAIYKRATIVLMEKFVPNDFLKMVETYRATIFVGTPFMYAVLTETFIDRNFDLSTLRLCLSAGVKLSREISAKFTERFGIRISQEYGATETGTISINSYENAFENVDSVGKPINGRVIKIVDDFNDELPANKTGNIKVKSIATTKGYLNDMKANRRAFIDGWYLTGDIGKVDPHGNLYITGRKGFVVNVAGLKVSPFEVEKVLLLDKSVKECAVIGIKNKNSGELVKAYIVADRCVSKQGLINLCKRRLADYKVPKIIEFVDELPKSPTGKVLRKYLVATKEGDL